MTDKTPPTLAKILKEEIEKLRSLNNEYQIFLESKKVVHTDGKGNKTRYYLKDGSTYVIAKNYRYLYDAKSKIITYEFSNGQVERTFPTGLKEIRHRDGSVTVKNGEKDYEYIECKSRY